MSGHIPMVVVKMISSEMRVEEVALVKACKDAVEFPWLVHNLMSYCELSAMEIRISENNSQEP